MWSNKWWMLIVLIIIGFLLYLFWKYREREEVTTELFNGVAPTSFTVLNLGVGQCMALLRIHCAITSEQHFYFRVNGETLPSANKDTITSVLTNNASGTEVEIGYVWLLTDSDGKVEWRGTNAQQVEIERISYRKDCIFVNTEVFNGALTNSFQTVDLGVGRCLAYLKVTSDVNSGMRSRRLGDSESDADPGRLWGMNSVNINAFNQVGYFFVPTNADGKIQIYSDAVSNRVITLLAYIPTVTWSSVTVFNGAGPTSWVDLALDIGNKLGVLYQIADAATDCAFRVDGEAEQTRLVNNGIHCISDRWGYGMMLTGSGRVIEWNCSSTTNRQMILIASFKPLPLTWKGDIHIDQLKHQHTERMLQRV